MKEHFEWPHKVAEEGCLERRSEEAFPKQECGDHLESLEKAVPKKSWKRRGLQKSLK